MTPTTFGSVIRRRRRQLELTQQEVARRIGVRPNYIGYLERDVRRPSTAVLIKLAKVLDLDRTELFFLAHPQVREFVRPHARPQEASAWEEFRRNKRLQARYRVTPQELKVLEQISRLGPVGSPRDYLFVLQAIRLALENE